MFSLPFIILPYLLGIIIAAYIGGYSINWASILFGFVPILLFHLAGNLQSDIYDFVKGIDVVPQRFSGGIVRKWISLREAKWVVVLLYVSSFVIGIFLSFRFGIRFVPFIIAGFLFGLFYSARSNYALKYNVLGEWSIFGGFGIILPMYAYLIVTGELSLIPVFLSLPAAFLIAAVKHANNWIAILTPGNLEKSTTAYRIGPRASRYYYYLLIAMPYIMMGVLLFWKDLLKITVPASMLITYLSLPIFVLLVGRAKQKVRGNPKQRRFELDSLTAILYSLYMFLCCTALIFW